MCSYSVTPHTKLLHNLTRKIREKWLACNDRRPDTLSRPACRRTHRQVSPPAAEAWRARRGRGDTLAAHAARRCCGTRPATAPADLQFYTLRICDRSVHQREATAMSASRLTFPRRRSHLCCLPATRVLDSWSSSPPSHAAMQDRSGVGPSKPRT
jgi:hypothetical protein